VVELWRDGKRGAARSPLILEGEEGGRGGGRGTVGSPAPLLERERSEGEEETGAWLEPGDATREGEE
jgi:hypothetical protein